MTAERQGALLVAGGAIAMSFAPVFVKLADVPPTTAGFYRMAVGGAVLAAVGYRQIRFNLGRALWLVILSAGAIFSLDLAFWHRSIQFVGPGLATILGNCQVFFVALFAWIVMREHIGALHVLGTLIALTGLFLLLGEGWSQPGSDFRWGVIFGLLTAVAFGAYILVLRSSQSLPGRLPPLPNMALISLVGAAGLLLAVVAEGQSLALPSAQDGLLMIGYGLIGQVLAWLTVSKGLPLIPASRASLILLIQPSLAFVWDVVLLGRPTSPRELAGAALALAGIYLGMRRVG